jgi:hypothetical protein
MKIYPVSLIAAAGLLSGCFMAVRPGPYGSTVYVAPLPPPVVVAEPPAPMPVGPYAAAYYTWDGYEYVGLYGDQYMYWNAGAWVVCDAVILGRFHGWERYHPGWRRHARAYHRAGDPHR